jgi:NADPH-dependent ferric siderophore reductase
MSSKQPSTLYDRSISRMKHELRVRLLEVVAVNLVTPHTLRVTLGGEQMAGFTSHGFDDHVKLLLPANGEVFHAAPELGPGGPVFAPGTPLPIMRDYTPHSFDANAGILQLDFTQHTTGPAAAWARRAAAGDRVIVAGPRGSAIFGTGFDPHLLIGDETALPAIRRRLIELPASAHALVIVEVDGPDDEQRLVSAASLDLHWLHRGVRTLTDTLGSLVFPTRDCFAWVACESSEARVLRTLLLERGVDPRSLKAAGYWRRGAQGAHDVHV